MTKQEMILDAALTLFSQKGFDGVSIDEIGDAVGMKGPAIYYYFKGKDALLESIYDQAESYYWQRMGHSSEVALPETLEEFLDVSKKRILFSIHDPFVRRIRRLLTIEQFRNEKMASVATMHFVTALTEMNKNVIRNLMIQNEIMEVDPDILAYEFTAPVGLLIQLLDREPQKEEMCLELIDKHFQHFQAIYGKPRVEPDQSMM